MCKSSLSTQLVRPMTKNTQTRSAFMAGQTTGIIHNIYNPPSFFQIQIQNSLFSTQHIVNTTTFSYMRRVEKGASRRQCLCGLVPYLNNINIYNTQFGLLIGGNDLNNHNNNVLAMLLQSCKHKKTRNSCRIDYIWQNWT